MSLVPRFEAPEHLGDPYLGAWYIPGAFEQQLADEVMAEVRESGQVEPIWDTTGAAVNQIFERLVIDLTKEHDFSKVEELGALLGDYVVAQTVHMFPIVSEFSVDEAAVQIYPAGAEMALGWHKDHKADKLLVISATLSGDGTVGFTERRPPVDTTEEDIVASIATSPLGALVFRANGLYERADGSDIRVAHAVTKIGRGRERFTIQYRMGVNAGAYGNKHVNASEQQKPN
jgi:hypothetical protein